MTQTRQVWHQMLTSLWFFRGPAITLPIAALLVVVFWVRGQWVGVFSSLAWFVMSLLVMITWKLKADQTRRLLERHQITPEDLSPHPYRTATSEVIEAVQEHEQVVFLSLPQHWTATKTPQQQQRWMELWQMGKRHFFLEGERCEEISPEGVKALDGLLKLVQENHGSLFVLRPPLELRLHLELVLPELKIFNDPESAMWIVWSKISE